MTGLIINRLWYDQVQTALIIILIMIMAEMAALNVDGCLIEERRRWPVI